MAVNERLERIVDHTVERMIAENNLLPKLKCAQAGVASEYVSAVLTAVCLYLRSDDSRVMKLPQHQLEGTYGRGPVDYVLDTWGRNNSGIIACVTMIRFDESIESEYEKAAAINLIQIEAAMQRDKKLRIRRRERKGQSAADDARPLDGPTGTDSDTDRFPIGLVSDGCDWLMTQLTTEPDGTFDVCMIDLPRLDVTRSYGTPACINMHHGDSDQPVPTAAAAAATSSHSFGASVRVIDSDVLRSELVTLLSYLLPPLEECIQYNKRHHSRTPNQNQNQNQAHSHHRPETHDQPTLQLTDGIGGDAAAADGDSACAAAGAIDDGQPPPSKRRKIETAADS